jgi:hypothetical protein
VSVRTRWPWISTLLAAIAVLNPVGLNVIHAAFFSGEALSRNIWRPIVLTGAVIAVLMTALEWQIRKFILHRQARGTTI